MNHQKKTFTASTVLDAEIRHFQQDSKHWWDEKGPFAPLHALNPIRMEFMVGVLAQQDRGFTGRLTQGAELSWRHLDIGCGGGLVAEPFARLGAQVIGLDADVQAIGAAKDHAAAMGLQIDYQVGTVEEFQNNKNLFDTVTALEIIEHVDQPDFFIEQIVTQVRTGGIIFISTLNRNLKSLLLGKIVAEYMVGWVPRGTHDSRKFVKPSELVAMMAANGCAPVATTGLCYHPIRKAFYADPHDVQVNYIMAFVKTKEPR